MGVNRDEPDHPDDDDTEWFIGFAEPAEFADDIIPPLFELPISVPLNVMILDTSDTAVRVRDAHVYNTGLLVTVDAVVWRAHEMQPHDRMELEHALLDVLDEDAPGDASLPSALISSSPRSTTRACVAQWEYWVASTDSRIDELRLRNPFENGDQFWHVPVDGGLINEARSRVVDLPTGR